MAKTKDIFALFYKAAETMNLPLGMIKEIFDANDTALGMDENGPNYHDNVFGDNYIKVPSRYLDEKGNIKPNNCWDVIDDVNGYYNEMLHAWWDQVFEERSECEWLYDFVKTNFLDRYQNNEEAMEEAWSETTDRYIYFSMENYKRTLKDILINGRNIPNVAYNYPPFPLTYEHTKQQVLHQHRFGDELSKVYISEAEWEILISILKHGALHKDKKNIWDPLMKKVEAIISKDKSK